MQIHDKVPDFSFKATSGFQGKLSDFQGKWVILYFYPKDATPGCTLESQQFRDHYPFFQSQSISVFGISRDSLASHEKFINDQSLPFPLISDETEEICTLFQVLKMKTNFGKTYRGIERSTFLIDPAGKIAALWRNLKVPDHVQQLIKMIEKLQSI